MILALGMALMAGLGPGPPVEPTPDGFALCDLAVRSTTLDYDEFARAATLRLPNVRVREADGEVDPMCSGQLHGYVELRLLDGDRWELSLISSDGRVWYRTVASDRDQAVRTLASALANLVAAIEDSSAAPDARAAELPTELDPSADSMTTEEPSLDPIVSTEPTPAVEPTLEPERPVGEVRLELGPRLGIGGVVGLAPGPGLRGGGGGFGLDLRLPDGLAFGLEVRALRSSDGDLALVRTRVALGIGAVIRNGRFELPVMVSGVVEPWLLRVAGDKAPLEQPPMVGGGARVAPGLLLRAGAVDVRLGLALGFEIAVEAANGGVTPAIATSPTADPRLRAGGVELSGALELGVWIPIRERR